MTAGTTGRSSRNPLLVAVLTTVAVAVLSYALPVEYAATGVGFAFLAATYFAVLRGDEPGAAERHGLALGGLLEPEPLDAMRLGRDGATAIAWAIGLAAIVLPPFWVGWVVWWSPPNAFDAAPLRTVAAETVGQLLVIALPEEAFYRGYLQTALDDAWPRRIKVVGAQLGPGLVVASALFALGHFLTEPHPNRLAVFVPALLFGWLRARTGGIGAAIVFHAACNLFASYLARSYGFVG